MKRISFMLLTISILVLTFTSCGEYDTSQKSSSGVEKAVATVQTDVNGKTVEQNNIIKRYKRDNTPGSIKHLYIISAYSGQVLIYSTVNGKVTSGNKRLSPSNVDPNSTINGNLDNGINSVKLGDYYYKTSEVLSDDGAFGSSGDYIYWFDSKDVYHQHYITGGQIVHISDQPLSVKSVILNMEISDEKEKEVITK